MCKLTLRRTATEKRSKLNQLTNGIPVSVLLSRVEEDLVQLRQAVQAAEEELEVTQAMLQKARDQFTVEHTQLANLEERINDMNLSIQRKLSELVFESEEAVDAAYLDTAVLATKRAQIKAYKDEEQKLAAQLEEIVNKLAGKDITEAAWEKLKQDLDEATRKKEIATEHRIAAEGSLLEISVRHERWRELETELKVVREQLKHITTLRTITRGNMLVEFIAQEQMDVILSHASDRLKSLTNNRYGLELASDGSFLIVDDDNAGAKRPVNTLSGGETFQTSLALALALSTQIQLKGQHPLEFFFLDEGFGSLDQKALEVVMSSLERLPLERMTIGLISHVEALQQRLLRRLIVEPAEPNGLGSQVTIEIA